MRYTEKSRLTIIPLNEKRNIVTYDEILEVLYECPANIIYVTYQDKLEGIISSGDIKRAKESGQKGVLINTKFTYVYKDGLWEAYQTMKANPKIKQVPIIDVEGRLLGEYAFQNEYLNDKKIELFVNENHITNCLHIWCKLMVLVRPQKAFVKKCKLLEGAHETLLNKGINVKIIDRKDIGDYLVCADKILFVDEDELIGTGIIYSDLLEKQISNTKVRLCEKNPHSMMSDCIRDKETFTGFLHRLQNAGIHIFTFGWEENEQGDAAYFTHKIREKYDRLGLKINNVIPSELKKGFYCENYEKYKNYHFPHVFTNIIENGMRKFADEASELVNVANGMRCTCYQPSQYNQNIYLNGSCVITGLFVEDKSTIASYLQDDINQAGFLCRVENRGGTAFNLGIMEDIAVTPFKKGDIVIFHGLDGKFEGVPYINLAAIYRNIPESWVLEHPLHCNHKVNKIIADVLFEEIKLLLNNSIENRVNVPVEQDIGVQYYINLYKEEVGDINNKIVGSIVMNCNPFTLGHRYLIEEAKKRVDKLIIFVVEEEKSFFSFEERLSMVRAGVEDMEDIVVIPSGTYILSNRTFPQYFAKALDAEIVQNVEKDITIFAESIVPRFNITYRFVGEEPNDPVTKEYNLAMKRILPSYGVQVVEIPRKRGGAGVISASLVRKLMEEGKYEEIDNLVPESTKNALIWLNE